MSHVRASLRRLIQQPGFSLTALLTLALCIGANLMMFAIIDSVLLRPLPFAESDRLVTVYNSYPLAGMERGSASVRDYFSRRGNIPAFASVSSFRYGSETLGEQGATLRRDSLRITPEFFDTLGIPLARGRSFTEQEMNPGNGDAIIISDAYWRQQLGADPQALGRMIEVNGEPKAVVGILPPGFQFLSSSAQILLPLVSTDEHRALNALHGEHAEMIARLAPQATLEQARAQLEAHYARDSQGYPWADEVNAAGFTMIIAGLQADHVASIRPMLLLLQGGVLCLLLIGAVNLVNLLLVRASTRSKELGVRRALGADGGQIAKQVLSETLLLSLGGAVLGLLVAAAGVQLLSWLGLDALPLAADVRIDERAMVLTLLAALLLGALLAAPILWMSLRQPLLGALQSETRGSSGDRGGQRLRQSFIVAQIALAFVLLLGASLLGLSLHKAMTAEPGFDPQPVLTANLNLPQADYPYGAAQVAFSERLLQHLQTQPGYLHVGLSTSLPVQGKLSPQDRNPMTVIGYQPQPGVSPLLHNRYGIAGNYFQALQIPLQQGRFLATADLHNAQRVCVVDEDFARFYWPEGNAIGQRLFEGPDARADEEAFTVVGVVGSVRQTELSETRGNGTIYFPYNHLPGSQLYLSVRSHGAPDAMIGSLRKAVAEVDPRLALDRLMSMPARIATTLVARRSPALLAAGFSIAALLLAGLGTFGVLSYAVAQRRREVGMRIALGATPRHIMARFLGQGLRLLLIGCACGLLGAVLVNQLLQQALPDMPTLQWSSMLATLLLLTAVTLIASLIPALRAARTSPLTVLAQD